MGVFCPGPVKTDFNRRAGVQFVTDGIESQYAARFAVDKMFDGKLTIIPGAMMNLGIFALRLAPVKVALKAAYHLQGRKGEPPQYEEE